MSFTGMSFAQKKPYSVTWQQFNVHTPPLLQIGELATKPADGTGNSRWSVGCETLDRDYADFSKYKQYVGELGVGYARIQSGWAKCEQEKGKYDFAWLDKIVDGLNEEGVRPWMCLCYGNPIYGVDRNLGAGLFIKEEVMKAWCKYVRETVKHYKGRIAMWEIWNEPNLRSKNNPEYYAEMLIRTAEEIRKIDNEAVILAFGLSGMPLGWTKSVMDIVKERKKLHLINYVSYHPYYPIPDTATTDILALRKLVKSYSEKIDIFQGETGCPSILEYGHAMNHWEWSEYKQVKWDLRRMANDFNLVIPSSIFTMVDLQYENMLQSFGLIRMNLRKRRGLQTSCILRCASYGQLADDRGIPERTYAGIQLFRPGDFVSRSCRQKRQNNRCHALVQRPDTYRPTRERTRQPDNRRPFAQRGCICRTDYGTHI